MFRVIRHDGSIFDPGQADLPKVTTKPRPKVTTKPDQPRATTKTTKPKAKPKLPEYKREPWVYLGKPQKRRCLPAKCVATFILRPAQLELFLLGEAESGSAGTQPDKE